MNYSTTPTQTPRNAVPCLAVITLGSDGPRHSALMSVGVDASATDRINQNVRTVYWRAQVAVTSVSTLRSVPHLPHSDLSRTHW